MSMFHMRMLFLGGGSRDNNLLGTGTQSFGECGLGNALFPNNGNPYVQQMQTVRVFTPPQYVTATQKIKDPDSWKSVFSTYQHSVAVKSDGTLWACGDNNFGQLGNGSSGGVLRIFTQVMSPDGNNASWVFGGGGTEHSGALRSDGRVFCWGRNDIAAAVGNGNKTGNVLAPWNLHDTDADHRHFPLSTTFIDLRVGHRFNIAMDQDRNLWTWGNNGSRQLGRTSEFIASDLQQNPTQDTHIRQAPCYSQANNTLIPGPWADFSAGAYHAGAINQDGSLWMWGLAGSGQLGAPTPPGGQAVDARQVPSPVEGKKWARIFCGEYSTAALLEDGTLWVWGQNDTGQLGTNDKVARSTPVQLPGSWRFCQLGLKSACGIKTDGTLWTWGSNTNGLAGLNAAAESLVPAQIGTDTSWLMGYPMSLSTIAMKRA